MEAPKDSGDWFKPLYEEFGSVDLGESWCRLLEKWELLEQGFQFEDERSNTLKAHGRPEAITGWINKGHTQSPRLMISSMVTFGNDWWDWWKALQPEWHVLGREKYCLEQTSYGDDWRMLRSLGKNGFASLIAGLFWWGEA
ncbi:hypothetical protein C8J56DRAFT_803608 [Mycena floridula]|nr:hypothetical protein C8J56DRAFT_803608 [Mycena floridula]